MNPATGGATGPAKGPAKCEVPEERRSTDEGAGQHGRGPANAKARLLKGKSLQFRPRPPTVGHRYSLGRRLTDRDRAIAETVRRHRVMTASHISQVFFSTHKRGLVRLKALADLGVLDRFQVLGRRGLPNEYHYVLGRVGASIVAAEHGDDPDAAARRWRGDTAFVLANSPRLAHAVGVSGFFAGLAAEGRRGHGRLDEWLTEFESTRWSEGVVNPDGFFVWHEDGSEVECFLEYDRCTEPLTRLVSKLHGYRRFEEERGESAWLLFAFSSSRREATARRALAGADVPVATGVIGRQDVPSAALWWPLGSDSRMRLAELPGVPKPEAALARAERGSARAWRFARSRPDEPEEAPNDQP